MALNGRYISTFAIISQVFRDTGLTTDIPWQDAIEWTAECLDLIGAPHYMRDRVGYITISNYRGELPCDFEQMTQASGLSGNGRQFPMRESTNSFHPVFTCDDQLVGCSTCNGAFAAGSSLIDTNTPIGEDSNGNPTFNFMNDTNVTLSKNIAGGSTSALCCDDATYKINDDYIFTSFEGTGNPVLIAYKARPIDSKTGFPLIPDNIKYKLAVQWYITMKADYILWRRNSVARDVFEYSEKQSMWYIGAAGTAARTPSIDKMESWKNQMLHLIPRINKHANFFKDLGSKESLLFGRKY